MKYQHIRENKKPSEIKRILNEKYNGNILFLSDAEKDFNIQKTLYKITKKKPLSLYPLSQNYVCLDIVENESSIVSSENPLISASLDQLYIRRLLPDKPSNIFKNARNRDIRFKDLDKRNELQRLFHNLMNLTSRSSFFVNNISKDQQGNIIYNTQMNDPFHGLVRQYGWLEVDSNKQININNDYNGRAKDFVDNNMMYNFFMMYGISKMYSRCTCDTYRKWFATKKGGMGNFFCIHLMYHFSMLPYYLYYLLDHSS